MEPGERTWGRGPLDFVGGRCPDVTLLAWETTSLLSHDPWVTSHLGVTYSASHVPAAVPSSATRMLPGSICCWGLSLPQLSLQALQPSSPALLRTRVFPSQPLSHPPIPVVVAFTPPFHSHALPPLTLQEQLGVHPCDRRSAVSEYRSRFPAVDFSLIQPEEDVLWHPERREGREELRRRGLAFLSWLASRPERNIAVVTHSSFLFFTMSCFGHGSWVAPSVMGEMHRWYDNCEMRSVVLCDEGGGGEGGERREGDPWHFAGGVHAGEEVVGKQ
ncbi:hypothetical protein Agub_g4823 [Astrephomene gubernaculifera]|uniref:Phosphoglycerate mutase-like protein n=1 Tax=Astrephomene gubernaculifera TaxID=47775 RepID=A0AAD3HK73_9CHLO|nr:hypothetical protein Agub_g4823 [Astrephomene gubernaculifera]